MGLTRDCIDPWTTAYFYADGGVGPCCVAPAVENVYNREADKLRLDQIIDGEGFNRYRRSLLSGELTEACRKCTQRDLTSVDALKEKVAGCECLDEGHLTGPEKYFHTARTSFVFLEITTRCNFRCIYCAHSDPSFDLQTRDFDFRYLDAVLSGLVDRKIACLNINGYGETTVYRDWHRKCSDIRDRMPGAQLTLISNFGRSFSDEEIAALSRLHQIVVSCDTLDPALFARLRKGGRLDVVLSNIQRVREMARSEGRMPPRFGISCVVSNLSIAGLPALVDWGIRNDIVEFDFCNLMFPERCTGRGELVKVADLPLDERLRARDTLYEAFLALRRAGGHSNFAGDLFSLLDNRCREDSHHQFFPPDDEPVYRSLFTQDPKGSEVVHLARFGDSSERHGNRVKAGFQATVLLPKGLHRLTFRHIVVDSQGSATACVEQLVAREKAVFSPEAGECSLYEVRECVPVAEDCRPLLNSIEEALQYCSPRGEEVRAGDAVGIILSDVAAAVRAVSESLDTSSSEDDQGQPGTCVTNLISALDALRRGLGDSSDRATALMDEVWHRFGEFRAEVERHSTE